MKRIFIFLIALSLWDGRGLRAQDAATEERLKKLNGLVLDLQESKETQRKQIESLSREIQSLREQVSKPTGNGRGMQWDAKNFRNLGWILLNYSRNVRS